MESPLEELSRLRRELAEEIRAMREESSFSKMNPGQGQISYNELIDFDTNGPVEEVPRKKSPAPVSPKDRGPDASGDRRSEDRRDPLSSSPGDKTSSDGKDVREDSEVDKRFRSLRPSNFERDIQFRLDDEHLEFEGSRRYCRLHEESRHESEDSTDQGSLSSERKESTASSTAEGKGEKRSPGDSSLARRQDDHEPSKPTKPKLTLQEEMALLNEELPEDERLERLSKIAEKLEEDSNQSAAFGPRAVKGNFGEAAPGKSGSKRSFSPDAEDDDPPARILRIDSGHKDFLGRRDGGSRPRKGPSRPHAGATGIKFDHAMALNILIWGVLLLGLTAFIGGGGLLGWAFLFEKSEYLLVGMPISLAGTVLLLVGLLIQLFRIWGLANRPKWDEGIQRPRLDLGEPDVAPAKAEVRRDESHPPESREQHQQRGSRNRETNAEAQTKPEPAAMLEELRRQVEMLSEQLARQREEFSSSENER